MHGNVPIFDIDMHFGIMKSKLILGIYVGIFKFLAINYSSLIRLGVRSRCLPIKRRIKSELSVFTGSFSYFHSEYEAASVEFLSIFAPRHFYINTCNHFFNDIRDFGYLRDIDLR